MSEINPLTVSYKLENMVRFLSSYDAPGIVVEVGVWQGGSLRYLAERFPNRQFFGFDTFEGMPKECTFDGSQ